MLRNLLCSVLVVASIASTSHAQGTCYGNQSQNCSAFISPPGPNCGQQLCSYTKKTDSNGYAIIISGNRWDVDYLCNSGQIEPVGTGNSVEFCTDAGGNDFGTDVEDPTDIVCYQKSPCALSNCSVSNEIAEEGDIYDISTGTSIHYFIYKGYCSSLSTPVLSNYAGSTGLAPSFPCASSNELCEDGGIM